MTTNTFGTTFGKAIGSSVAHAGHFAALTATGITRFAGDAGTGMVTGYTDTAATRLIQRQQRAALREALAAPATPIGITITA